MLFFNEGESVATTPLAINNRQRDGAFGFAAAEHNRIPSGILFTVR